MIDVLRGKYRIVREIARSNDIVYEALDSALGRRVAIKELAMPEGLAGQARRDRIERFTREARAAGRLSHPNIVAIYEFGEENGRYFIAMEYLEGQNLRDITQIRGALPLSEAINIACQVLDALAYAHNNRVVHRDIKPDNIQVLPGGQVKLTDFGIARLTEEPQLTSHGQVFGTPSYMSPEQIEGRSIDHRSDLFSLAVVLYEMLTGRKPFTGDSVVSITYAIMHAEPPPMPGVPTGIEQVIRRALSKRPEQRQVSADQMKLDLRNAEKTPPIFFNSPTGGYTSMPPVGQTGLGQAGTGYSYQTSGRSLSQGTGLPSVYPGYTGPWTGQTAPPGSGPGPTGASAPPPNSSLPWAWNTPGADPNGAPALPSGAPGPQAIPGSGSANGAPPFAARPPQPLLVLTPGLKRILASVLAMIALGSGLAYAVIWVLNSYEQYKMTANRLRVEWLIKEGVAAYNAQDYAGAIDYFEQARVSLPDRNTRATIAHNLTAAYVQRARQAQANGRMEEARSYYEKALNISPNSRLAHQGLAETLERLDQREAAQSHREAAQSSLEEQVPASLWVETIPGGGVSTEAERQQPIVNKQREAAQLIQEGKALYQQGNQKAARQNWLRAIELAPGTPERDEAKQLLEQSGG